MIVNHIIAASFYLKVKSLTFLLGLRCIHTLYRMDDCDTKFTVHSSYFLLGRINVIASEDLGVSNYPDPSRIFFFFLISLGFWKFWQPFWLMIPSPLHFRKTVQPIVMDSCIHYHPCMGIGNNFSLLCLSVCLYICLSVCVSVSLGYNFWTTITSNLIFYVQIHLDHI